MGAGALRDLMRTGHAIDPDALADLEFRGISLGLPRFVERLTWKTFQKVFHRDPQTGALRGWNVRLEQRGIDADSVALQHRGQRVTFGHYQVVPLDVAQPPRPCGPGLMIDYGRGGNSRWDPMRCVRDPLVAVHSGSVDLLLGWSYVDLGFVRLSTPSYFLLQRERPLSHRVAPPHRPALPLPSSTH